MISAKEIIEYVQDTISLNGKKQFSWAEAKQIGDTLGISWGEFSVEQFRMGLNIECGHGRLDRKTDAPHDESIGTGKIVLAHLHEIPDYYSQLTEREEEAEHQKKNLRREDWGNMYSTERNTLFIVLLAIICIVMFVLEVRQPITTPSTSTTAGLHQGSSLR